MLISRPLLDELISHAREEAPNECCGVVAVAAGRPMRAATVHRAVNIAASPLRFEVDGRQLLHTIEQIEGAGSELGAISRQLAYLDAGKTTLGEFVEEYWRDYAVPNLAPRTRTIYLHVWAKHAQPMS